eukprot:1083565-Amphidinium_carterae.2
MPLFASCVETLPASSAGLLYELLHRVLGALYSQLHYCVLAMQGRCMANLSCVMFENNEDTTSEALTC